MDIKQYKHEYEELYTRIRDNFSISDSGWLYCGKSASEFAKAFGSEKTSLQRYFQTKTLDEKTISIIASVIKYSIKYARRFIPRLKNMSIPKLAEKLEIEEDDIMLLDRFQTLDYLINSYEKKK